MVERSFAWLIKNRRLVRDFEQRTDVAQTWIRIAAIGTMLKRIEPPRVCRRLFGLSHAASAGCSSEA